MILILSYKISVFAFTKIVLYGRYLVLEMIASLDLPLGSIMLEWTVGRKNSFCKQMLLIFSDLTCMQCKL